MPFSIFPVVASFFSKISVRVRNVSVDSHPLRRKSKPPKNAYSPSSACSYKDIQWQAGQSTSFADLPPELVIQIFKELDSFFTAWVLCKTSRQIESIFTLNSNTILHDVAFRSSQARELASAQELVTMRHFSLSTQPATAQNRSQRMSSNVSAALRALSHYEASVFSHYEHEGPANLSRRQLTPAEKSAFLKAYYRALTLVTLGQPKIPFESLARLNMLEYMQMREATMLLTPVREWKGSIDLGINFPHIWSPENGSQNGFKSPFALVTLPIGGTFTPTVNWEETLLSLSYIEEILLQNPACHCFHCGEPKPFYYFTVFDGYQKEAKQVQGVKLGELIRNMNNHRRIFSDVVDFADEMYNTK